TRDDAHARVAGGAGQAVDQRARVDLAVARSEDAAGAGRGQPRLELPAGGGGQPARVEPEGTLELVQAPKRFGLVAVERDVERAVATVARRRTGLGLELRDERGERFGGGELEPDERLLAEVDLGDRHEHAGGH